MRLYNIKQSKYITEASIILGESWNEFTLEQQDIINDVTKVSKELITIYETYILDSFLNESKLSIGQITALFNSAVKSDENTSMAGKAINVSKLPLKAVAAIDAKVNELGKLLKDTQPIKNMDIRFNELKKDIISKKPNSEVIKAVEKYSNWAKQNPKKSSFVVGILTTISSILAGPLGGLAAGFFIGSIDKLLKGQDLSTALGTSVKTAAYGYLAGVAFKFLSKEIIDAIGNADHVEIAAAQKELLNANKEPIMNALAEKYPGAAEKFSNIVHTHTRGNINGYFYNFDVYLDDKLASQFEILKDNIAKTAAFTPENYEAIAKSHEFLSLVQSQTEHQAVLRAVHKTAAKIADITLTPEQVAIIVDKTKNAAETLNILTKTSEVFAGIVQGAIQQAKDFVKPRVERNTPTNESINEGLLDSVVQKTTFKRLESDWINAGRPTDSEEIIKILTKYFSVDTVNNIFRSNHITFDKSESSDEKPSDEKPLNHETIDTIISKAEAENIDKDLLIDYIIVG